jgi:hypothetical protein
MEGGKVEEEVGMMSDYISGGSRQRNSMVITSMAMAIS